MIDPYQEHGRLPQHLNAHLKIILPIFVVSNSGHIVYCQITCKPDLLDIRMIAVWEYVRPFIACSTHGIGHQTRTTRKDTLNFFTFLVWICEKDCTGCQKFDFGVVKFYADIRKVDVQVFLTVGRFFTPQDRPEMGAAFI